METTYSSEPLFNEQFPDARLDPLSPAGVTGFCNSPPNKRELVQSALALSHQLFRTKVRKCPCLQFSSGFIKTAFDVN